MQIASGQFSLLQNRLDHLIANSTGLRESRSEVVLNVLELFSVAVKVTKADTVAPILRIVSSKNHQKFGPTYSRSKCKFKVVAPKSVVVHCDIDDLVQ